jgi:hypothetical protein
LVVSLRIRSLIKGRIKPAPEDRAAQIVVERSPIEIPLRPFEDNMEWSAERGTES